MTSLRARGLALLVGGSLLFGTAAFLPGGLFNTPAARAEEKKEKHPRIHAALRELREAKKELEKADHDFGGHRVEAIKAIDHAIVQLEKALNYDKK